MNEKTTNVEEGKMGREGKRHLGLVRETAFKSETPSLPQANALNCLQRPARCSQPQGCRTALQSGALRRLLGRGPRWGAKRLCLITVAC